MQRIEERQNQRLSGCLAASLVETTGFEPEDLVDETWLTLAPMGSDT